MQDRFYGMLGLCTKAGKVLSGSFQVEHAIQSGEAFMVVIANDASDSSKEAYRKKCEGYKVAFYEYGLRDELSKAIGKDERTVIAITDEKMANALQGKMSL